MNLIPKNRAYDLFRNWVSNAKRAYSNLDFDILEPTLLERDLLDALDKAVKSLRNDERVENREQEGYDFGFICGFVEGNLNVLWHFEYIYKQSNIYKTYSVLTALDSHLKFDDILRIKLEDLYRIHYRDKLNLSNINDKIKVQLSSEMSFLDMEESDSSILAALEIIKVQMIKDNMEQDNPNFLAHTIDYFTPSEIKSLINQ